MDEEKRIFLGLSKEQLKTYAIVFLAGLVLGLLVSGGI